MQFWASRLPSSSSAADQRYSPELISEIHIGATGRPLVMAPNTQRYGQGTRLTALASLSAIMTSHAGSIGLAVNSPVTGFASKSGSLESLNVSTRHGRGPGSEPSEDLQRAATEAAPAAAQPNRAGSPTVRAAAPSSAATAAPAGDHGAARVGNRYVQAQRAPHRHRTPNQPGSHAVDRRRLRESPGQPHPPCPA